MPPIIDKPNYSVIDDESYRRYTIDSYGDDHSGDGETTLTQVTFYYLVTLIVLLLTWLSLFFLLRICSLRQKTRSSPPRRMYGSRTRDSLQQSEPTIFVSPNNFPPPPKYDALAPPSYDEVVGVHYPQYRLQQPITLPIATALGQTSNYRPAITSVISEDSPPYETVVANAATAVPVASVIPVPVTVTVSDVATVTRTPPEPKRPSGDSRTSVTNTTA